MEQRLNQPALSVVHISVRVADADSFQHTYLLEHWPFPDEIAAPGQHLMHKFRVVDQIGPFGPRPELHDVSQIALGSEELQRMEEQRPPMAEEREPSARDADRGGRVHR